MVVQQRRGAQSYFVKGLDNGRLYLGNKCFLRESVKEIVPSIVKTVSLPVKLGSILLSSKTISYRQDRRRLNSERKVGFSETKVVIRSCIGEGEKCQNTILRF